MRKFSIAGLAREHFGNPIPEAVYAFARALLASQPTAAVSDEQIMHIWGSHVGWPNEKYQLTAADVIRFVRALLSHPAALAQPAPAVSGGLRHELQGRADNAYCAYIDQMRRSECLGWEAKVKAGQFGEAELKAHTKAGELLGRHRAFAEGAAMLAALSAPAAQQPSETAIRKKIADELRSSAFLHTDVNKEHVLLAIEHGHSWVSNQNDAQEAETAIHNAAVRAAAQIAGERDQELAKEIVRTLLRPAAQQADELRFNATRLRNVAKLVGLGNAVPADDATLDGARGSVLGMIAGALRNKAAQEAAREQPAKGEKELKHE